jgi:cation transport protein ChaC
VVTLIHAPGERCWGAAFRLAPETRDDVLEQLDYREKGGYARELLPLHTPGGVLGEGLVYVATPENPNWLGPAPLPTIAARVRASTGPSGPNDEYVLRLAEALREMGADDPHVFDLAALITGGSV